MPTPQKQIVLGNDIYDSHSPKPKESQQRIALVSVDNCGTTALWLSSGIVSLAFALFFLGSQPSAFLSRLISHAGVNYGASLLATFIRLWVKRSHFQQW